MANYNDVPIATQQKNNSQPLIKENFVTLMNYLQYDHETITANGKHNKTTYKLTTDPVADGSTDIVLYNKLLGTVPTMYFQRMNGGVPTLLSNADKLTSGTKGYTILPSGLMIQWSGNETADGVSAHTFAGAGFTTHIFAMLITSKTAGTSVVLTAKALNSWQANAYIISTGAATTALMDYIAIGI